MPEEEMLRRKSCKL